VAVAPTQSTVFVATRYIPAGTPFSVISSENLLKRETVSSTQAIPSAIYDPSQVSSQTTTESIAAGQQVTTVEFRPAATVAIPAYLQGTYRGVAFSMNSYQGLTAGLKAGEFVDVMLVKRNGQSELLASNIEVLSNLAGNVILRLTDKQALLLTAGTTIGTLWLDYRPAHGAKQEIKVGDQEAL
jgi:Flp pilus assembly protein CpaB